MMRILKTTAIFIAFLLTLVTVIVGLRLPESVLIVIAGGILISIILVAGACIWYVKLMAGLNLINKRCEGEVLQAQADEAKAKAKAAELAARIIDTSDGTWLVQGKKEDGSLHLAALGTNPRWDINGHPEPVSHAELFAWQAKHHRASNGKEIAQLQSGIVENLPAPLDLLTILTQPTQSYAIIGGQQVGKTYQARRIANYWLQAGNKPIVIGPKWDRGEWDGCTLFGGEYNFERVSQGMRIVQRLAEERHADKERSHKEQPVQPVFFDDWTAIRAKLETEAEAFILDATTLYASVNIILYFIIHLDTANAWGVGRVGAALHQNFYKLFVEPGTNEMGLIDRSRNMGWLLRPGRTKKDRERIQLFGGMGQPLSLPAEPVILRPTQQEQQIISLHESGASMNEIARQVFGHIGGNQNKAIKEVLSKFGYVSM